MTTTNDSSLDGATAGSSSASSSSSSNAIGGCSTTTSLLVLFLLGLGAVSTTRRRFLSNNNNNKDTHSIVVVLRGCFIDAIIGSVLVYTSLLPEPSIAPWWGPLTSLACYCWPALVGKTAIFFFADNGKGNGTAAAAVVAVRRLIHGGPLGRGCRKLVEVIVAIFLHKFIVGSSSPRPLLFSLSTLLGPLPGWKEWVCALIFSAAVAFVLHLWSTTMLIKNSVGGAGGVDHQGVKDMVANTHGRSLSLMEHCQILGMALVNAFCEEVTSRWFWRNEFARYLPDGTCATVTAAAARTGRVRLSGPCRTRILSRPRCSERGTTMEFRADGRAFR